MSHIALDQAAEQQKPEVSSSESFCVDKSGLWFVHPTRMRTVPLTG